MQIRRLTEQDIPDLLNAINDAFADYIVPFQLNTLKCIGEHTSGMVGRSF